MQTLDDDATDSPSRRQRPLGFDLAIGALVGLLLFGVIFGVTRLVKGEDKVDATPLTAVEVGFLHDMTDHHRQAIEISNAYIAANRDGGARHFATEIILYQDQEIGVMEYILTEDGKPTVREGDVAMAWMGHSTPVASMPGMQTPDAIQALTQSSGAEADTMFFALMADHHQGGIEMMDAVLARSRVPSVRELATKMRTAQRQEIIEFVQTMRRLGLTGEPLTSYTAVTTPGTPTTDPHAGH